MQLKAALLSLFAVAATAHELAGLPDCAQTCLKKSFPVSGCTGKADFSCLCKSEPFITAARKCVAESCEFIDDILETQKWSVKKCKSVGVEI